MIFKNYLILLEMRIWVMIYGQYLMWFKKKSLMVILNILLVKKLEKLDKLKTLNKIKRLIKSYLMLH